jgi:hypothetical protein
MSISRFALLAGHVVGNWIQAMVTMGVLLGVAVGFGPHADGLR